MLSPASEATPLFGTAEGTLVVAHYHWRTGGVRRVIEHGVLALLREKLPGSIKVRFLAGEPPPEPWRQDLERRLRQINSSVHLEWFNCPEMGYVSELSRRPHQAVLRRFFREHLPDGALLWVHNPALARNPLAHQVLDGVAVEKAAVVLWHHHDFWCDNRWGRWAEAQLCGFRSPAQLAAAIFPVRPGLVHLTINRADQLLLEQAVGNTVHWVPNVLPFPVPPVASERRAARRWLREKAAGLAADTRRGRVWLLPCRWLRRKNILEGLLLSQLLDREAVLVTSGSASSDEEKPYLQKVRTAVRRHSWPLCLIDFSSPGAPPFHHLMAAADVITLPSLQEGFGLAYIEATLAARPLVCRRLSTVQPDLDLMGFTFPQSYEELHIASAAAGGAREVRRQEALWQAWRSALPRAFRPYAESPPVLRAPSAEEWAFSRLTLTGQLEVLRQLLPLQGGERTPLSVPNPHRPTELWATANYAEILGRAAFSAWQALASAKGSLTGDPAASARAQEILARNRLRSENLYPLLLSTKT